MGFELVKTVVGATPAGGWAKHFFYETGRGELMAFWELHDESIPDGYSPAISTGMGLPEWVNHVAFAAEDLADLDRRRERLVAHGYDVLEIDHGWCRSIYTRDPNGTLVEFCTTTREFDAKTGAAPSRRCTHAQPAPRGAAARSRSSTKAPASPCTCARRAARPRRAERALGSEPGPAGGRDAAARREQQRRGRRARRAERAVAELAQQRAADEPAPSPPACRQSTASASAAEQPDRRRAARRRDGARCRSRGLREGRRRERERRARGERRATLGARAPSSSRRRRRPRGARSRRSRAARPRRAAAGRRGRRGARRRAAATRPISIGSAAAPTAKRRLRSAPLRAPAPGGDAAEIGDREQREQHECRGGPGDRRACSTAIGSSAAARPEATSVKPKTRLAPERARGAVTETRSRRRE